MAELIPACKVHIRFYLPWHLELLIYWYFWYMHNYTTHLYQPSLWLTKYRERIFPLSNREIFGEERLSIPTEMKQRLLTLATHRVVLSNRGGKRVWSTRQCGNDLAGFLEALFPNKGSTTLTLLVVGSLWSWSTTSWLYMRSCFPLPVKEDQYLTLAFWDLGTSRTFSNDLVCYFYFMHEETDLESNSTLPKNVTVSEERP